MDRKVEADVEIPERSRAERGMWTGIGLVSVGITGVSDPDNNATIVITAVTQDEPTNGLGDGDTAIDAVINPDGTVLLRAERAATGNGRVYHVHFTASDPEGSVSGVVTVSVPKTKKSVDVGWHNWQHAVATHQPLR